MGRVTSPWQQPPSNLRLVMPNPRQYPSAASAEGSAPLPADREASERGEMVAETLVSEPTRGEPGEGRVPGYGPERTRTAKALLLLEAGQEDEELVAVRPASDERHLGVAEHAKTLLPGLIACRHDRLGAVLGLYPEAMDRRLGAVRSPSAIESRGSVRHRLRLPWMASRS